MNGRATAAAILSPMNTSIGRKRIGPTLPQSTDTSAKPLQQICCGTPNLTPPDLQAGLPQLVDLGRDHRRHAVTMDLPVGPDMAKEPSALAGRQVAPQCLRLGAQAVDDAAPIDAVPGRGLHLATHGAEQPANRRRQ